MARKRSSKIQPGRRNIPRMPLLGHRFRPLVLELEDRNLLSGTTFTVTNTLDDGSAGSLRYEIGLANANSGASTITFDSTVFSTPQTITLDGTPLRLSNTTGLETITGPAAGVTVNGGGPFNGVFEITANVTASISGLTITGGMSGGLYNDDGNLTLNNCIVTGNSTTFFVDGPPVAAGNGIVSNGPLTLVDCTISGNYGGAGGIYSFGPTVTMVDCTVNGNEGGGLVSNGATLTLNGCAFLANFSANPNGGPGGGAIRITGGNSSIITNCTFTENVSTSTDPSAIQNNSGAGLSLINCTISGNVSQANSPAIANETTLTLLNSISAENSDTGASPAYDISGSPVNSQGHNLIGSAPASGFQWASTDLVGTLTSPLSADLASPGNYGGPTVTIPLLPGSPAIGAGATGTSVPTTDQRGFPRGGVVDIGAFQGTVEIESTSGSVDTSFADLTLPGAVALSRQFGGLNILFDPAVFTTATTISLTAPLELGGDSSTVTITGPAAGLIVSGGMSGRVFEIDFEMTGVLNDLTISGGSTSGNGGGVYNQGNVDLNECTVSGNSAQSGAGLFNASGAIASFTDTTLSGNTAGANGGAIYNQGGTLTLTNTTLSGNSAGENGGGIFNGNAGVATLLNCTIDGNSAGNAGGGVDNAGRTFTLANTIIAGNTAFGPGPDVLGVFTSLGTNLIGETNGSSGWISSDLTGTEAQPLDPKLGSLQNNGGPNETLALLAGSPAIDTGSNEIEGLVIPTTDERGAQRGAAGLNAGTNVDIGAYEASSSYLVTTALDSYAVGTLRSAVGWANLNLNDNPANLASPAANTIYFDETNAFSTPQVITLDPNLGTLVLSNTTTPEAIADPPAGLVTISGGELVGVFMVTAGVTAMLSGVTITGGSTKGNGGGIDDEGGDLTLDNVVLSANKAGGTGGGVFVTKRGTTTMIGCSVVGNSANYGGGVYADGNSLALTNITISGNAATKTGGGVFVSKRSTSTLIGCSVVGNTATSGGGVYSDGTSLSVSDTTISGNAATSKGGGVFISKRSTSSLINCTAVGNIAANGGGVYNDSPNTSLEFCTITGNTASIGAGLSNDLDGAATLEDTIVAGNSGSDIGGANSGAVTGSYNLIGTGGSGGISNGVDGNQVGVSDPGLGSLGNYGGSNETIPLLPGSPGIATGVPIPGIGSDERGTPIEPGNPVDIGAFQSLGFTIVVTLTSTPQSTGTGDPFANPLIVTAIPNDSMDPVAGGTIDFTAETGVGGASAVLSSGTVVIAADGTAQVSAVANSNFGSYQVVASSAGAINSGYFDLTNLVTPVFTFTSPPSTPYASTNITISGTLAFGTEYPLGEYVKITFNGTTARALIGSQGAFSSSFALNASEPAGTVYPLTFTYAGDADFGAAQSTSSVKVAAIIPTLNWPSPSAITYGTPLSSVQLDATQSAVVGGTNEQVAGTLIYSPPLGTVLGAGNGQTLTVTFTPTDMTDFATVTSTTTINVAQATPTIAWANSTIYLGTPLSAKQLDATTSWSVAGLTTTVPGIFSYSPALGTVLPVGPDQPISVSFQPTDETDYNTATAHVQVNVLPAVNLQITHFSSYESTVQVGDTITYTVVVTNSGPSVATGVTLNVAFGDLGTASASTPTADPAASVVSDLGTIPVGGSATAVFTAIPNVAGSLSPSPQIQADQFNEATAVSAVASPLVDVLGRVGTIQFSESAYVVPGNAALAAITVTRINGTSGTITLNYSTVSVDATPGLDYTPVAGTLTFPDGVASETIFVPILSDPYASRDEVIQVVLTNIQNSEGFITPAADSSSTATLAIAPINPDTAPLAVTAVNLGASSQGIDEIEITFNKPLDPARATDSRNYTVTSFATTSAPLTVQIGTNQVLYSVGSLHVTVLLPQSLPMNQFFELSLNAGGSTGLRDRDGQILTTNGAAGATTYSDLIGMGTNLAYTTAIGQEVDLKLTGGGLLEDVISSSGVGFELTIVGEVPHHSVLSGSVKKGHGTRHRVYLAQTVRGLGNFGDVRVKLNPAQFQVGSYPFSPGNNASNVTSSGEPTVVTVKPPAQKSSARITTPMARKFHAVRRQ